MPKSGVAAHDVQVVLRYDCRGDQIIGYTMIEVVVAIVGAWKRGLGRRANTNQFRRLLTQGERRDEQTGLGISYRQLRRVVTIDRVGTSKFEDGTSVHRDGNCLQPVNIVQFLSPFCHKRTVVLDETQKGRSSDAKLWKFYIASVRTLTQGMHVGPGSRKTSGPSVVRLWFRLWPRIIAVRKKLYGSGARP